MLNKTLSYLLSPDSSVSATGASWAVLAQFCYVGRKPPAGLSDRATPLKGDHGMTPGFAANYLTGTMVACFFIRPFHRTRLISRFAPHKVLAAYALFANTPVSDFRLWRRTYRPAGADVV